MTRTRGPTFPLGPLTPDDLPAGIYLVSYREAKYGTWWRQPKIRLEFVIVEPVAYAGLLISLFATCKEDRNKRSSRRSKYYRLWARVHGGPPQRGQRMTSSIFAGYWLVQVGWGRDDETGEPTIPIITDLLERVAGGGGG